MYELLIQNGYTRIKEKLLLKKSNAKKSSLCFLSSRSFVTKNLAVG
jgi:hypothetical protein